jgi:Raf kinase inhibitor-like YbhB/YbcL family protein
MERSMIARSESVFGGLERLEPRLLLSALPVATLTVENPTADEATGASAVVRVTLDHAPGVQTVVRLSFSGTACRGREYEVNQKTIVFGPNDVTGTVLITPIDDGRALGDSEVTVKIRGARGYAVGEDCRGTVTIVDKEPTVSITAVDGQAAETYATKPSDIGVFRITQTGDAPLRVAFSLQGTASSIDDYTLYVNSVALTSRIVTVPPGSEGLDITLVPIDDTVRRSFDLSAVMRLAKRAGYSLSGTLCNCSATVLIADNDAPTDLVLTSPDFVNGHKFTNGDYFLSSPTFNWTGAPQATQSFAFIVETPCPVYKPYVQWVVYNISADATSLQSGDLPSGVKQGPNSAGFNGWVGPIAPEGTKHFYYFTLYALDVNLNLPSGVTRAELLSAMSGHVLDSTRMTATCGDGIPVTDDVGY